MAKEAVNKLHIEKGMRFGSLIIIKELESDELWRRRFLCQCDCGNQFVTFLYRLTQGKCTHCDNKEHLREKNAQKYIDKKYGKLTVLSYQGYDEKTATPLMKCKCDCGNETIVKMKYVIKGDTKSCGCNKHHVFDKQNYKHGDSLRNNKTRLYSIWMCMKNRCLNPNSRAYQYYGARGIKICEEWINDFVAFREWALANNYQDNLSIDRIDVNGNYEPSNCRWATIQEQANNKRNSRRITFNGETHTIYEWSKITGISREVLNKRYLRNHKSNDVLGNIKPK